MYDPTTDTYEDNKQVTIQVPGFGKTDGVEFLRRGRLFDFGNTISYMHTFVKYFVDRGYVRGETIRAAPYDWRLAAGKFESITLA